MSVAIEDVESRPVTKISSENPVVKYFKDLLELERGYSWRNPFISAEFENNDAYLTFDFNNRKNIRLQAGSSIDDSGLNLESIKRDKTRYQFHFKNHAGLKLERDGGLHKLFNHLIRYNNAKIDLEIGKNVNADLSYTTLLRGWHAFPKDLMQFLEEMHINMGSHDKEINLHWPSGERQSRDKSRINIWGGIGYKVKSSEIETVAEELQRTGVIRIETIAGAKQISPEIKYILEETMPSYQTAKKLEDAIDSAKGFENRGEVSLHFNGEISVELLTQIPEIFEHNLYKGFIETKNFSLSGHQMKTVITPKDLETAAKITEIASAKLEIK